MSHYPKVPVRFVNSNAEMLDTMEKSSSAGQQLGATDYKPNQEAVYPAQMTPQYRTAPDRVNGNVIFRRYVDGTLDVEYAKHQIIDAIHKVRDHVPLNSMEEAALSCCFPRTFSFIDPGVQESVRTVNLKISLLESMMVAQAVALHLAAEIEYKRYAR